MPIYAHYLCVCSIHTRLPCRYFSWQINNQACSKWFLWLTKMHPIFVDLSISALRFIKWVLLYCPFTMELFFCLSSYVAFLRHFCGIFYKNSKINEKYLLKNYQKTPFRSEADLSKIKESLLLFQHRLWKSFIYLLVVCLFFLSRAGLKRSPICHVHLQ